MQDLIDIAGFFAGNAGLVLLAALALEGLTPLWRIWRIWRYAPHPVALTGRGIGYLAGRWRASAGGNLGLERVLGWIFLILISLLAILTGLLMESFLVLLGGVAGFALRIFLVGIFLSQRELGYRVGRLFSTLEREGVAAARGELHHVAGRDADNLDADDLRRAGLESLAENFSDGIIAPGLWFLFFGLSGLFFYKTINTADSMIGYTQAPWKHFGSAAARIDDIVNWLPARLSAVLLSLSGGLTAMRAWRTAWRDGRHHRSANAGWPEAAMAAHLDLALAGPRSYFGEQIDDAWMNDGGSRSPSAADCTRALTLYRRALGLFWLLALLWSLLYATL
ncbi:MAG: cobalamin biosynthesis protein [Alphaproteobacteria bacterium]